mgnify:CR=1 FL=1
MRLGVAVGSAVLVTVLILSLAAIAAALMIDETIFDLSVPASARRRSISTSVWPGFGSTAFRILAMITGS